MIVSVTKKHIYNGKRNDCYTCPIALAIIDATGCDTIVVDETTVSYGYKEDDGHIRRIHHNLPRSAKRFIKNYDDDESVSPMRFRLSEKTKCQ